MSVYEYHQKHHAIAAAKRIYERWSPHHQNILSCAAVSHPTRFGYAVVINIDTKGDKVVSAYMKHPKEYSPKALRAFLVKRLFDVLMTPKGERTALEGFDNIVVAAAFRAAKYATIGNLVTERRYTSGTDDGTLPLTRSWGRSATATPPRTVLHLYPTSTSTTMGVLINVRSPRIVSMMAKGGDK